MKKLLCLLLTIITINCYSEEVKPTTQIINKATDAVERVYADGTKVVEKAYSIGENLSPKIEKALLQLGTSLKVSGAEIWNILVRQQIVWSVCILLGLLLTVFSWWHFYYRVNEGRLNQWKTDKNNTDAPSSYHVVVFITLGFAVTGTIVVGMHFNDMLTGFINPKFGALKTIAEIAAQIK